MTIEVLNPTYDDSGAEFHPARRLDSLDGAVVGIISNGKHGTVPFFDQFEFELRHRHGVAEVVRLVKPNYSAPAGDELLAQARHWHALIAGVGD